MSPKDSPLPVFLLAWCLASSVCARKDAEVRMAHCKDEVDLFRLQSPIKCNQHSSHLSSNCVGHAASSLVDLVTYNSEPEAEKMYDNKPTVHKQKTQATRSAASRKRTSSAGGVLGLVYVALVRHDGCRE